MPGLLRWMDIDDILLLCAPRPVLACPGLAPCSEEVDGLFEGAGLFYGLFEAESRLRIADAVRGIWPVLGAVNREG